jgi:hypothetical protein
LTLLATGAAFADCLTFGTRHVHTGVHNAPALSRPLPAQGLPAQRIAQRHRRGTPIASMPPRVQRSGAGAEGETARRRVFPLTKLKGDSHEGVFEDHRDGAGVGAGRFHVRGAGPGGEAGTGVEGQPQPGDGRAAHGAAGRIVEYRQKSGGFKATNELMNVVGIGEKNFVKLQPYITVGGSDSGKAEASAKKVVPARSDAQ